MAVRRHVSLSPGIAPTVDKELNMFESMLSYPGSLFSELDRLQLQSRVWEPAGRELLAGLPRKDGARAIEIAAHSQPDLVLLGFTINDVPDNYLPLKARMAQWSESAPPKPYYTLEEGQLKRHNFPFPPPPAEVQPETLYDYFYKYSLSYRVAEKGWQSLKLKIAELSQPPAALELNPEESRYPRWTIQFSMRLYMNPLPAEHEAAWQLTEALLRAFQQEVAARQVKFAVYSNSTMWTVHPSIQEILVSEEPLYASAPLDWEQPDRRLTVNLQAMGVPYLLLDPPFRAHSAANNDQLLFFREGHWNEAGHQLAAELIYEWLIEQKLVP